METGAFVATSPTKNAVSTWLIITISEATKQKQRPTKSKQPNLKKKKENNIHTPEEQPSGSGGRTDITCSAHL